MPADHQVPPLAAEATSQPPAPFARFVASFVLVPGGIILACVLVFMTAGWITSSEPKADQLVDLIESRGGNTRWRAAIQLAAMLADPECRSLREDRQLARRIAGILQRELRSAGVRREEVTLATFLCRALGEFHAEDSLPALVAAAEWGRHTDVRRSAVESLALLADSLGPEHLRAKPEVARALITASRDADPALRQSAAFALGVMGGMEAEDRLAAMLADEHVLVRYNAATALARHGNALAADVLLAMLLPDQGLAVDGETDLAARSRQHDLIRRNAVEAIRQLMEANPAVSEAFRGAFDKLRETETRPACPGADRTGRPTKNA